MTRMALKVKSYSDGFIGELDDPDLAAALLEKLSGISPEERKKRLGEAVSALLLPSVICDCSRRSGYSGISSACRVMILRTPF